MNENETKAPGVGEVPPKPEGCVYGPWWDDRKCSFVGLFWRTRDGGDSILDVKWFDGIRWFWTADCSPAAHIELLRVSTENAALRALVGELGDGLALFEKLEEIKDRQASAVGRRGTKRGIAIDKDEKALFYQALDIEAGKITDQIATLIARAKEVLGK